MPIIVEFFKLQNCNITNVLRPRLFNNKGNGISFLG